MSFAFPGISGGDRNPPAEPFPDEAGIWGMPKAVGNSLREPVAPDLGSHHALRNHSRGFVPKIGENRMEIGAPARSHPVGVEVGGAAFGLTPPQFASTFFGAP